MPCSPDPRASTRVRARYLVGCDGAHSTVRKTLGLTFEGAAFAEQHPPTGAQGMNTGIQDAQNLAWRLALAVAEVAAPSFYIDNTCDTATLTELERHVELLRKLTDDYLDTYLVASPTATLGSTILPVIRDSGGDFARRYRCAAGAAYIVRPDGYLGYAASPASSDDLVRHVESTFAPAPESILGIA